MQKTTVIFHAADWDGLFCREIARKFLPDAELIGWDFKDKPLAIPPEGTIYILDLPVDRVFGFDFKHCEQHLMKPPVAMERIIWIDHHKSSIESHPTDIPGYRIDGVAACRLAWQWFRIRHEYVNSRGQLHHAESEPSLPSKELFVDRRVPEPLAVRLAGEYDIWDKRDPRAELFQHGLRSRELGPDTWDILLSGPTAPEGDKQGLAEIYVDTLLDAGKALQFARANEYRDVITQQGFDLKFEGLTFLACNSHELDIRSHLFAAGIQPHHDALLGFTYNGKAQDWRVSLYRIDGREVDILSIAKRYGGGGHPGACGFRASAITKNLQFIP